MLSGHCKIWQDRPNNDTRKAGILIIHCNAHYKCQRQTEGEENHFHYLFIMYHDQFHNNDIN